MSFKERMKALKEKRKALIKPDMSEEDIKSINDDIAELDELEKAHDELVAENAKFKDTIVRMVTSEGNGKAPKDDSSGSKSMSIEEAIAQVENGGK